MKRFTTQHVLRGGLLSVMLLAGCQNHGQEAAVPSPSAKVTSVATTAPISLPSPKPTSLRGKPDFGGVSSQHVETTATGPTLQSAIDAALRLAIEQVNGKTLTATSTSIQSNEDVSSAAYADAISSATAGAITHFKLISQKQVNTPTSTDEEQLKASRGASWNKGSVDASASQSASLSHDAQGSMSDDARASSGDSAAEASGEASGSESDSASASQSAELSGRWDQQTGATKLDYDKKHIAYVTHWEVTIGADVATYRLAEGAKLTRVVVAKALVPSSTFEVGDNRINADVIADEVQSKVAEALSQTHRFTVLDRQADAQITDEISRIQSGNSTVADTARLGQQLATDLIVIPTINRFEYVRHERALRMADRTLVSYSGGGAVSFRVVNATTGQLVMSQSFSYAFPSTDPTTMGISVDGAKLAGDMLNAMDHNIVSAILLSTYPLSILQVQGNTVVINQGGDAVQQGAAYQAVTLGAPIVDPQTGQSLGPTETPCCIVQIDRVTPNLSYGHFLEPNIHVRQPFAAGSMELRGQVAAMAQTPARAQAAPAQHAARHTKPKVTADAHQTAQANDNTDW